MEKNCIVVVKCRWNDTEYVYPKLLTDKDANRIKAQRTDANNEAYIKKVVYSN